jgi:hypothetical protein
MRFQKYFPNATPFTLRSSLMVGPLTFLGLLIGYSPIHAFLAAMVLVVAFKLAGPRAFIRSIPIVGFGVLIGMLHPTVGGLIAIVIGAFFGGLIWEAIKHRYFPNLVTRR